MISQTSPKLKHEQFRSSRFTRSGEGARWQQRTQQADAPNGARPRDSTDEISKIWQVKLIEIIDIWQSPILSISYPLPEGAYAARGVRHSHLGQSFNVVGQLWRPARHRNASSMAVDRRAVSRLRKGEAELEPHTINTVSQPKQHGLSIQERRLLWTNSRMRCTYSKWPQHPEPGAGSPVGTSQFVRPMMLSNWYLKWKNTRRGVLPGSAKTLPAYPIIRNLTFLIFQGVSYWLQLVPSCGDVLIVPQGRCFLNTT